MKTFAKNEILMFLFLKSDWLDTQKQQTDRQTVIMISNNRILFDFKGNIKCCEVSTVLTLSV